MRLKREYTGQSINWEGSHAQGVELHVAASIILFGYPMPALAEPGTKADFAGEKICWSDGNVVAYSSCGSYTATGVEKGHGTWRLEGVQLVVRTSANEGFNATITKENGSLHAVG